MATAAQILANQANARHSTGPITEQGKARSSQNHLSHGLSSREFVLLPGEQAGFDEFMAALRDAVQPAGALEFDLFTQLAHASWKLRRCRRAEVRIYDESACPDLDPALVPETEARLRSIQIYAQRAERTYHKALKELKALQSARAFKTSCQYTRCLSVSDSGDAAPLSEQHKVVGSRIALASLEANAQQAQALSDLYAVVDAPVPCFSGPGLADYATPHLSAETQHQFKPAPGSTAAGRSAAA
jgi:hypothetical protein